MFKNGIRIDAGREITIFEDLRIHEKVLKSLKMIIFFRLCWLEFEMFFRFRFVIFSSFFDFTRLTRFRRVEKKRLKRIFLSKKDVFTNFFLHSRNHPKWPCTSGGSFPFFKICYRLFGKIVKNAGSVSKDALPEDFLGETKLPQNAPEPLLLNVFLSKSRFAKVASAMI